MEIAIAIALLPVLLVSLFIVVLVQKSRRQRRRRQRLLRWASEHGWTFTPTPAVTWGARLPGGNKAGVCLALSATVGPYPVSVGEYAYTEAVPDGTGATSQTHQFIVMVVYLPQAYQPVAVRPRTAMSKLGRRLGHHDATATGDARFDRQFKVQADDPAYARRVVGPALVAEHLAGTIPPWNLYGNELLAFRPGRLDHPEQVPALIAPLVRAAGLLGR